MRRNAVIVLLLAGLGLLSFSVPAAGEDKGIIALQQSVSLLMNQVADLQKSFNTSIGMLQGLVSQDTDTVNKLASTLNSIQQAISGNQVVAAQQQSDIGKQFQELSDTIVAVQAHLQSMDDTLKQIHQMQQTIPAPVAAPAATPNPAGATGGGAGDTGAAPAGSPVPAGADAATPGMAAPPAAPAPSQLYQAALADFGNDKPAAESELASFIHNYPNDPQVPDATYFLGTIFMQKQEYNEAIDRFSDVIEQYPDSAKAPMAELNKGISYAKQGNKEAAISELRALAKNYPGSEAARQADIELKQLTRAR